MQPPVKPFCQRLLKILDRHGCKEDYNAIQNVLKKCIDGDRQRLLSMSDLLEGIEGNEESLSQSILAESAVNIEKRIVEYTEALQHVTSFEDLLPPAGTANSFSPPILAAKELLKQIESDLDDRNDFVAKYETARQRRPKKEGNHRPIQLREAVRRAAFELCEILRVHFPPETKKDDYGNSKKSLISNKALDVAAEIMNEKLFHNHVFYGKPKDGKVMKDERVKPLTRAIVKKLFHDRKFKNVTT